MSAEKYVIVLSDRRKYEIGNNSYGYYSGKNYTFEGELFPVTDRTITERTKVYSGRKRAENALKSILERNYAHVAHGWVEPYKVD